MMKSILQTSSVTDVFCGVGGLTHGFVKEGFSVLAGIDSDLSCKYAYEHNNNARFIHKPIEDIDSSYLTQIYPKHHTKILVGCAPCQPYSRYTKKQKNPAQKWKLLDLFADLILGVQPDIVSMENVPELQKFRGGEVYNSFLSKLSNIYYIKTHIVYCPDYGIPQKRRRLVLLASKYGEIEIIPPTHRPENYVTVADAIKNLPAINAGETHHDDTLHRASGLSEINLSRIKSSRPGGTWRDWDESLVANCHKKSSGQSYEGVYGRMTWNDPSPTITTECNAFGSGRFGHPEQNRAISLREAALLQTFPAQYKFVKPNTKWHIATVARHIGNAVPVDLGRIIARSIRIHLESHRS